MWTNAELSKVICGICSETTLFKLLLNQLPIKHDSWHIRPIRTILCFAVFCYGYVLNNLMHIFHDYVITVTSNGHDGVSNHQPRHCLFIRLFRRRSKKTLKLRVTGLCAGNSPWPVNSPHKWPVTLKMFPFVVVIMVTGEYFFGCHWCHESLCNCLSVSDEAPRNAIKSLM